MKDRIIEMLERGERVELECVDRDGFARRGHVNERLLSYGKINIDGYYEGNFSLRLNDEELDSLNICRVWAYINDYELKYFKIKEPEYTFNHLIDVAVQAAKDGIVIIDLLGDCNLIFKDSDGDNVHNVFKNDDERYIKVCLDWIDSLYTETFVIESEEDLGKISSPVESIVLANGEDIIYEVLFHKNTVYFNTLPSVKVPYSVLKGATVTQKPGNQCNK